MAIGLVCLILCHPLSGDVFQIPNGDVDALIDAMETAQEGDVIHLAQDGEYILTEVHNTLNGDNGLPVIENNLTIEGNGATLRRDSAAARFRILYLDHVDDDTVLRSLIIQNGHTSPSTDGAGIYAINSHPVIESCTFENNSSSGAGGGYYNDGGSPWFTDCVFRSNFADEGGGLTNRNGAAPVIRDSLFVQNNMEAGGGIFNRDSDAEIVRCVFTENDGERGGGIFNLDSTVIITDCEFINNVGWEDGGAIYNGTGSDTTITNCLFDGNVTDLSHGAGILNGGSTSTIRNCEFRNNHGPDGGAGIANFRSDVEIIDCLFTGNTADFWGGAIFNWESNPTITHCRFVENVASWYMGGAIYNTDSSHPVITHSTFERNVAADAGGAIFSEPDSTSTVGASFFCENNPDHVAGSWTDLGLNQMSDDCTNEIPLIERWRDQYFGTPDPEGDAADDADPDGDGLPNLLEYALAAHPLEPSIPATPALGQNASGHLTLTFERFGDRSLMYTVEADGDLTQWDPVWTSTGTEIIPGPVTVTDPEPIMNHPRRFLRLSVSQP